MRILLLLTAAGCSTTPTVVTTPATLSISTAAASPDRARSAEVSALAVSTDPVIVRFVPSPPGTDCHAAAPEVAELTVLLDPLPPLVSGPGPAPIGIQGIVDPSLLGPFERSQAALQLFGIETQLPIGTLYPDDDAASSGRLTADAQSWDGTETVHVTGSYAVDELCLD